MEVTLLGIIVFLHPAINLFVSVWIMALQLLRESYTLFPRSTLIEVKPLHPKKTLSSINVTLLGMVIDVKPLQPAKAQNPMLITLLGMVMEVRPVQLLNILSIDNQQLIH